jgi:hypothetical protein
VFTAFCESHTSQVPFYVADLRYEATVDRTADAPPPPDRHTGKDIAKYLGVSRATLCRYLTEHTAA